VKTARADRSLETDGFFPGGGTQAISVGAGIRNFASLNSSSQKCEEELKVKISSSSSSSSAFFFQWKYLLEKEKEESWGVLAVMAFICGRKREHRMMRQTPEEEVGNDWGSEEYMWRLNR
jgi:hypothetical protein